MTQQRRHYQRQQNYNQYQKPYYVKKSIKLRLLQYLITMIASIFLLTGAAIYEEIAVFADVYPVMNNMPPLIEEEIDDSNLWIKNLLQRGKTKWNPQQYVELCHANGIKVWGTVSSFIDPSLAEQIVTNEKVQTNVINQLVDWTRAYNLDGISIDFEKMNPEHKKLFTEFAKNLKNALPVNQNIVSVAVTVKLENENSNNWYQCYDRGGLAEVIDYVAVMTYEGHKRGLQAPVAPIDWVESHIIRLLKEMPSDKLIMGIPFYGVDFISRVVESDSFDVELLWKDDSDYRINFFTSYLQKALAYNEYTKDGKLIQVNYWLDKGSWNDTLGVSQYSFVDTNNLLHTIYIDDESSLYQKGALAIRYNLAGVGIWREGFGDDAMWEALADGLS